MGILNTTTTVGATTGAVSQNLPTSIFHHI